MESHPRHSELVMRVANNGKKLLPAPKLKIHGPGNEASITVDVDCTSYHYSCIAPTNVNLSPFQVTKNLETIT